MAAGYQLKDDFNRTGPVKFGGVPGVWAKDVPVAIDDLPVSEKEMDAAIKATDAPIRKLNAGVKPKSAESDKEA